MAIRKHALICALSASAWLAMPLAAQAQTYTDPIFSKPPPEQDGGSGGSHGGDSGQQTPRPPTGSSQTGQLTDATGQTATITLDNKALQFQSTGRRDGAGLEYDAWLDSSQGGGANGGFPFWEANGDWAVTESARCEVTGPNTMTKVAGTKEQTFSCYVEWMNGSKKYVDQEHCEAGANNTKPAATKPYKPASCPHPEWVIGNWGGWSYTSNWYRSPADSGKTCGPVTQFRDKKRTRSLSCMNGSDAECLTFNGPVKTTETGRDSRTKNLEPCFPPRKHYSWYPPGFFSAGVEALAWASACVYLDDSICKMESNNLKPIQYSSPWKLHRYKIYCYANAEGITTNSNWPTYDHYSSCH